MPTTQHIVDLSSEVLEHWESYALAQQAAQDALVAYIR